MSAKQDFHAYMYGMRLSWPRMVRLVIWAWFTGRFITGFGFHLFNKQYVVVVEPRLVACVLLTLVGAWALIYLAFSN